MARVFERRVGDKVIEVTLDPDKDLKLGKNLGREANKVAATIGLVGELMADVAQELRVLDGQYRSWRATAYKTVLNKDHKIAEWKARQFVESRKMFMEFKEDIGKAEGDLEFLRRYHEALRTKASMIRGRIELLRIEHGATTQ